MLQCGQDHSGSAQGMDRPPACHGKCRTETGTEASVHTDTYNLHMTNVQVVNIVR